MEINICHLYPDLLNVYGDIGNVHILKYRLEKRGIKTNIVNLSINEEFNGENYDIVLFGGGQDCEQSIVSKDLMENKKEAIKEYIESGKVMLSICAGYQLLGKYYTTAEGERLEGLDILPIYTDSGIGRFIGNTVIINEDFSETYVGFENHSGRTYIGDLKPLGRVIRGFGNNGEDGYEGCVYKNTFGTYFHGCLLSKNPELADRLLKISLENKYGKDIELSPLDDSLELKAKDYIIKKND
ncbi:type 1 glutamine amidotransferase [Clostridium malenominatum]|uniref:Lipid II isoglutaminyl synthase (glutamine-hydrolyzing) subunit GatD n=1 Tax=Clostridium malenominatum TaxID=1539 RepID=A0ABN1J2H2_9CLOT